MSDKSEPLTFTTNNLTVDQLLTTLQGLSAKGFGNIIPTIASNEIKPSEGQTEKDEVSSEADKFQSKYESLLLYLNKLSKIRSFSAEERLCHIQDLVGSLLHSRGKGFDRRSFK